MGVNVRSLCVRCRWMDNLRVPSDPAAFLNPGLGGYSWARNEAKHCAAIVATVTYRDRNRSVAQRHTAARRAGMGVLPTDPIPVHHDAGQVKRCHRKLRSAGERMWT